MRLKKIKILLLGLSLFTTIIGCNTGTIRDYSLDTYESVDNWELSNEMTVLSLNNYIVFDGGHSLQINNDGCGDLTTKMPFDLDTASEQETDVEAGQTYEISVTVKRSATDYNENTPVEDDILRGDNFSVIINQDTRSLLNEEAVIELDFTWETKTFTFVTESDQPVKLTFKLGCDLELFWIDNITFRYIEPEPVEEDD